MQALNDYVIIKEVGGEETTESGIVLGTLRTDTVTGTVVSLGTKAEFLKGGDTVVVRRPDCRELSIEGEKYLTIRSEFIILRK